MPFQTCKLRKWRCIEKYSNRPLWLFRGQRREARELKTTLERSFKHHRVASDKCPETEKKLMREFRRAYHHYARRIPDEGATLEWLSLMQHHGAPTRLLDFSYSPYVATYFACEGAKGDCAVWAINGKWALHQSICRLRKAGKPRAEALGWQFCEGDEQIVDELFFTEPYVQAACPVNPFRLSERLQIQRGVFLIPGDVSKSFVCNLKALPGHDEKCHVVKLVIPHSETKVALRDLFQMGISRAHLFPGLDGFASSLDVYNPVVHDPEDWTQRMPKRGVTPSRRCRLDKWLRRLTGGRDTECSDC